MNTLTKSVNLFPSKVVIVVVESVDCPLLEGIYIETGCFPYISGGSLLTNCCTLKSGTAFHS